LGKTNPLNEADLREFVYLSKARADSQQSWRVDLSEIDPTTWDLSVKNPNTVTETEFGNPEDLIAELESLSDKTRETLATLRSLL
jgi:type I restriction enzyme M protein